MEYEEFRSCVTNRKTLPNTTQNVFSDWDRLQRGVLQGSIVWPLLFIIHVNDLLRIYSVPEPMLFADDLVLLFKAEISKIFIQCQIQFSRK